MSDKSRIEFFLVHLEINCGNYSISGSYYSLLQMFLWKFFRYRQGGIGCNYKMLDLDGSMGGVEGRVSSVVGIILENSTKPICITL